MRSAAFLCALGLGLGLGVSPACAQYAINGLVAGEVAEYVGAVTFGGSCYVNRGFATFQRTYTGGVGGPKAVISFAEIFDSGQWDLSGQAVMTFSSTTGGDIRFKQATTPASLPASVRDPQFSNYAETFDGQRLLVTFTIAFPDCRLPITAVFDPA